MKDTSNPPLMSFTRAAPSPTSPSASWSATRTPRLQVLRDKPPARRRRWLWLQAACAVLAVGLITLLLLPREDDRLPDTIAAQQDSFRVNGDNIELESGWYVLNTGAPAVKAGGSSIEQVIGRAVVKVGEIPDEQELRAQNEWLRQNGVEEDMSARNWMKVGGMAVCLLVGSAVVDGQPVHAQEAERKRVKELENELEKARKDLERAEHESEHDAEEPAWDREQAEKELKARREELDGLQKIADLEAWTPNGDDGKAEEVRNEREMLLKAAGDLEREIRRAELTMEIHDVEQRVAELDASVEDLRAQLKKEPDNDNLKLKLADQDAVRNDLQRKLDKLHLDIANLEKGGKDEATGAEPITIDFVQKNIHEVMHTIAMRAGLQIVVEGELQIKITVMFREIRPREAIRAICKANQLEMIEDGGVIIIKQGKAEQGHVTRADDSRDPDAPINVNFVEVSLSEAIIDIQKRSGLNVEMHLPPGEDPVVTLHLEKIAPRAIVKIMCEGADLRVIDRGDLLLVRPALADMSLKDIEAELDQTRSERGAVENRMQFSEVAREAAQQEGDKQAVKEHTDHIAMLKDRLNELDGEIKTLEEAVKARKR